MLKAVRLTPVILFVFLHFIVSIFTSMIPAKVLRFFGKPELADTILFKNGVLIAKGILFFTGSKVQVTGLEHIPADTGKICFVSNHQSYLDIPLIVAMVPRFMGFVAKAELEKIPLLHMWMEAMHCVYIKRDSPRSSIKAIIDGVQKIKDGHPLLIFPEGTRSKAPVPNAFHPGSVKLATRSQAIVVPISIQGTYKLLEKRERFWKDTIRLTFHPAVDVGKLSEEEIKELPEALFKTVQSAL